MRLSINKTKFAIIFRTVLANILHNTTTNNKSGICVYSVIKICIQHNILATEYTHIPLLLFVVVLCKIFAKTVRKIMAKSNKANGMQKYRLNKTNVLALSPVRIKIVINERILEQVLNSNYVLRI
jgi:hypothetical protein